MPTTPKLSEASKQRIAALLPKIAEKADTIIREQFNPYKKYNLIDTRKLMSGIVAPPDNSEGSLTLIEYHALIDATADMFTQQGGFEAEPYYPDFGYKYPPFIRFEEVNEEKAGYLTIDPKKKEGLLPELKQHTVDYLRRNYDPTTERNLIDVKRVILENIAAPPLLTLGRDNAHLPSHSLTYAELYVLMEALKSELKEEYGWDAREYYSDIGYEYPPYFQFSTSDLGKTGIVHIDEARKKKYLPELEKRLLEWPEQNYRPYQDNAVRIDDLFSGIVDCPQSTVQGRERLTPGEYQALMAELRDRFNAQTKWSIAEFEGNGPVAGYWLSFGVKPVSPPKAAQDKRERIGYPLMRMELV
ncbi:MAG: hypothetical protein V1725_00680 [archaeon]